MNSLGPAMAAIRERRPGRQGSGSREAGDAASSSAPTPTEGSHAAAVAAAAASNAPARRRPARSRSQRESYLSFDDIPPHLQDNEFILRGYRAGYSFRRSLASLFRLHNETGNIWTHLIGGQW